MSAKKSFLILSLTILMSSICGISEANSAHAITIHPDNKLNKHETQCNQLEYQTKINVITCDSGAPTVFGVDSASGELVNFSPWAGTEFKRMNLPSISPNDTDIGLAGSQNNELYYINGDYDQGQVYVLNPLDASIIRQFQITGGWGVDGLGYQSGTPESYLYTSGCMVGDMHRYVAADEMGPTFFWGNVTVHDAVGGDDCGRVFAPETGTSHIVEVDPLASQIVSRIPCSFEDKIVGMAYDGIYLYASTLDNQFYVLNAYTGEVINEIQMDYTLYALAALPCYCPVLLEKADDVNDGDCVGPGDYITYRIDYNYPNEPNCPDINDVNIIDYLPPEVDFNDASVGGVYNSDSHTVTWNIGTLSPGTTGFVTLKVDVICPEPCGTIKNECVIESNDVPIGWAYENTPVCCPTITKVDDVNDGDILRPGDEINYSICYAANGYSDTNVVIIDSLPNDVNFVSSEPEPDEILDSNTIIWNIGTLGPNDSNCIELTVKLKNFLESCEMIINCCKMIGDCININACEYTAPYFVVDTFDQYSDTGKQKPPPAGTLKSVWVDGNYAFVLWPPVPGTSGSLVQLNTDTHDCYYYYYYNCEHYVPDDEYIAQSENQSMKFYYDNDGTVEWEVYLYGGDPPDMWSYIPSPDTYLSEAYAAIDDAAQTDPELDSLDLMRDWSSYKVLKLSFYGDPNNDINNISMYAGLEDGSGNLAVIYHPDSNCIVNTSWHDWYIELQDFANVNDVNLADIARIYLGFGDKNAPKPGGSGVVFFDDIQLCWCSGKLAGDLNDDCKVNFIDFAVLASEWLESGCLRADLYEDGKVDLRDLDILLDDWLKEELWVD